MAQIENMIREKQMDENDARDMLYSNRNEERLDEEAYNEVYLDDDGDYIDDDFDYDD